MAVNPFTGEDDGVNDTLQPIVSGARNVGQGINDALMRDPESRSALLQIGLGLMQPVAMGQSVAGHIGQGIGGGGEAVGRIAEQDLKQQKADDALTIAEQRMQLAAARAKDPNTLTEYQRQALGLQERARQSSERGQSRQEAREIRLAEQQRRKEIEAKTEQAIAARDDLVNSDSPNSQRWKGKTDDDIRAYYEAQNPSVAAEPVPTEPSAPPAVGGAAAAPPPEKRVPGQVYPTPKGKLKWTGTGWVAP